MSPKSRHAPLHAVSHYQNGSRHAIPRHQAIPGYSSSCFSSASQDANILDSHFSLSSSTHGSRHCPEPSQWSAVSGSPPQPDDFLSFGFNEMNVAECYNSVPMMMDDIMDSTYDYAAASVIPRHTLNSIDQSQGLTQDFVMPDYISGMDYVPCTTAMDTSTIPATNSWTGAFRGPPSPPDEEIIARQLGRHGPLPEETTGCEHLGISKIQPYSASRHSVVQPRPIRPQSERIGSQQSSRHASSPESPTDDSADKVKARNDPLYEAPIGEDGYFRCPLENEFKCSHPPTKQRCIYAKYLDSHLRPYKCRYAEPGQDCLDARFSSNACLFRHEREAHGKHGHGENPFLCKFSGCPRAKHDNGFPRSWNQRDHMKRVHGWEPKNDEDEQPHGRHAPDSRRRKGASGPTSASMKRSTSSYYGRTPMAPYPRDTRRAVTSSRYQAASYNPMQTGNMMAYDIQYAQYQAPAYYSGYSQAVY